jgi:hypothetical protein
MVHWAAEGFTSFSHFPTRIFFLFPISSQNIALKDYSLSFKDLSLAFFVFPQFFIFNGGNGVENGGKLRRRISLFFF